MTRLALLLLSIVVSYSGIGQQIRGSWYGRADVPVAGTTNNYLTEFVLKQKGNTVEGVFGYYFKDTYQSFFVRGSYNPSTRQVSIRNIPLLYFGSTSGSDIECPMHFTGTLMVSKVRSTLKGRFYTESSYRYTCPELTVNMTLDANEQNQDSTIKNTIAGRKFWKPQQEDIIVIARPEPDSVRQSLPVAVANTGSEPDISAAAVVTVGDPLAEEFGRRNNIYEKDIEVRDDSILVSFYDNGDIDDDTISVFLNKKPILIRRGLSARALNIYIGLDSTIDVHELTMFADNLGKFPPNTALMVISDGQKRYELYLSASLKQNASVRLRRPRR